jgi:hypothetical protein
MARKRIVKIKITCQQPCNLGTVELASQVCAEISDIKARWQLEKIFTLAGWKFEKMEVVK